MAQQIDTTNPSQFAELSQVPSTGRTVALDLGTKRVGVAVSDELQIIARPLERVDRTSWKKLLLSIKGIVREFDAVALVIGLPLGSDGSESEMSAEARDIGRKLRLSIGLPVFLQDERVTSYDAKGRLWSQGIDVIDSRELVDSEAAAIILEDFLKELKASRN